MRFQKGQTTFGIDDAIGFADDGRVFRGALPSGVAGVNHPAGWVRSLTPEERTELGFVELPEPERFDERYYFAPGSLRPLADIKARRLSDLAALRWSKEIGGMVVNGVAVATDDRSQAKLIAARIKAKENAAYTVNWKANAGFVALTAAQVIGIADAVADHIQDCFDNEAAHAAAINAYTDAEDVIEHDITTGWPT